MLPFEDHARGHFLVKNDPLRLRFGKEQNRNRCSRNQGGFLFNPASAGKCPSAVSRTTGTTPRILLHLFKRNQGVKRARPRPNDTHLQPMFGEWLSLVEHLVRDQGVGGSNPLSPTNIFNNLQQFLSRRKIQCRRFCSGRGLQAQYAGILRARPPRFMRLNPSIGEPTDAGTGDRNGQGWGVPESD